MFGGIVMRRPAFASAFVLIGLAAVVLAGCRGWHPGHHGSDPSIAIVAPGDHTQVGADGNVAVSVRIDRSLSSSSLRLAVVAFGQAPVDVTDRLHETAHGFTAALTAADLAPGLNRVIASARPRWHHSWHARSA